MSTLSADSWHTLRVGGGGYATGLQIASDGTMVVRTDTNGAYLWNGLQWQQLVTSSSMPTAFDFSGQGVYEIVIAPSNSSVMYMMFDGYVFVSTNKGTTWTQTKFTQVDINSSANPNDGFRIDGQKMAVDPNNFSIVYAGTEQNGLFVSTNGGQNWSRVNGIPSGTTAGITGILFDAVIGGVINGVTQTIFAASSGNGVYESTNGGTSWHALSGGPIDVEYAAISSAGVYYAVGNSNSTLWSYASGKWTELISDNNGGQGIQAVAINPANPNEIVVVAPSGYLNISYNAGATWTGNMWSSNKVESADIPWLVDANTALAGYTYLSVGGVSFNPVDPSQVVLSGGTGVWTTTQVPTSNAIWSTPVTWSDMSAGIENLVANEIIVPPGGDPVLASWDRPFFHISNPDSYPTTYGPISSAAIVAGWSVDYASSSSSFLVGIADWWGHEESGYSTDGGQTWASFSTEIPGAGSSFIGGTIAASSQQNIVWAPAGGNQPYYTLNGGATWTPVTLPGVSNWSNFDWIYYLDQRSVTADRVLSNTFYLYDSNVGVFSSTNGGQSWSMVHSGSIGPSQYEGYNSTLMSVPGEKSNLFYTGGWQSGATPTASIDEPFYRSTNGGATWTAVSNVLDVFTFGFGAAAPGQVYPAIYIVGYVNNIYGIWQSSDNAQSWTNIGTYPNGELDQITTVAGDPNHYGKVYVGFNGGGYAYLSDKTSGEASNTITDPATPSISTIGCTTSRAIQVLTGRAEAQSMVIFYDNGSALGTVTTDANGSWSAIISLSQGSNTLTARATNAAGNISQESNSVKYVLDTPSVISSGTTANISVTPPLMLVGGLVELATAVTGTPMMFETGGTLVLHGLSGADIASNFTFGNVIDLVGISAQTGVGTTVTSSNGTLTLDTPSGVTAYMSDDGYGGTLITPTSDSIGVYRFFEARTGVHFYTSSETEARDIEQTRPEEVYEGLGLTSIDLGNGDPNAVPIYRFFESTNGSHFYTANIAERDAVIATRPDMIYETGDNFYEHLNPQRGDVPVYRFFDSSNGTHFYTDMSTERANILNTRPDMIAEGITFYEAPSTRIT